jgi:hypothetical protein
MSSRRSKTALALALLASLALVAAVAGLVLREHTCRTLHFGTGGIAELEFVNGGRWLSVSHESLALVHRVYPATGGSDFSGLRRTDLFPAVYAARAPLAAYLDFARVRVVDIANGYPETRVELMTAYSAVALAPGGETVAVVTTAHKLELRSTRDATLSRSFDVPESLRTADRHRLAFSPRGDQVALEGHWREGSYNRVHVWGVSHPAEHDLGGALVGFTSLGEVVTNGVEPNPFELVAHGRDGIPRALPETTSIVVALSADGARLAAYRVDGSTKMVEVSSVETGVVLRRVRVRSTGSSPLALSPEGDQLAIAYDDGAVEVWDVPR